MSCTEATAAHTTRSSDNGGTFASISHLALYLSAPSPARPLIPRSVSQARVCNDASLQDEHRAIFHNYSQM